MAVTDPEALPQARAVLERELEAIDLACSRFRDDSELVRAERGAGREVEVSALLLEALLVALRAAEVSGGLVDPTVGSTMRLAGYDRPLTVVRGRDGRLFRPSFAPAAGVAQGRAGRVSRHGAHAAPGSSSTSARPRRLSPPIVPRARPRTRPAPASS